MGKSLVIETPVLSVTVTVIVQGPPTSKSKPGTTKRPVPSCVAIPTVALLPVRSSGRPSTDTATFVTEAPPTSATFDDDASRTDQRGSRRQAECYLKRGFGWRGYASGHGQGRDEQDDKQTLHLRAASTDGWSERAVGRTPMRFPPGSP